MKCIEEKPQFIKVILSEYQHYLSGAENDWFTVAHKHNWDGGYICKNGEYYKKADFLKDFDQMIELFNIITKDLSFKSVTVFPVSDNIFEHWSDVMSYKITKKISKKIKDSRIVLENGKGFEVDVNNDIIRDIIYASFNYLVDCILIFNNIFAIIPTHNFEFRIYTPSLKSHIEIIVSDYEYVHVYE